jgi:multidrug efflux system outer membrane protein
MKIKNSLLYSLLTFSIALLQGCMVGPQYSRPETVAESDGSFINISEHIQAPNDVNAIDNWWLSFGDTTTTELVRKALENNYELKAAAARVLQGQAMLEQARGAQLPSVSYGLGRSRSKMSFKFGPERFSNLSTTWSQNISVAYVLDIFGKLRHSERAAWAELLAAQANQQALTNSIIATVIRARIDIATSQRALEIARSNTLSLEKTLLIVQNRYDQGLVGPVDIRMAKERLASARALEPALVISLTMNCPVHCLICLIWIQ